MFASKFMFFWTIFGGIFVMLMISELGSGLISLQGNETDLLALLDFKNHVIQDPLGIMASWNDSVHYCNWTGITCNSFNRRVEILDLRSQKLVGSIRPSIGNLSFLTGINLRNNGFQGKIPQEIGLLSSLKHLNLTYNSLSGNIPSNLSYCTELTFLGLEYNQFVGQIPEQLNALSKLQYLGVGSNYLTGGFPSWIVNFSSQFFGVSLALNSFQGSIPPEIGRLSGLRIFQVYGNQLSGMLPSSIYNLSSMSYFSVTQNQLHGEISPDVGLRFPNLEVFAGGVNNFKGLIPVSLSNASRLSVLDFAQNIFTGTIPKVLGILQSLYRINFDSNNLGNGKSGDMNFLTFLTNCTNLQVLGLSENFFGGELPNSIANLSTKLEILTLGGNLMHGNLPIGIGNLVNLTLLGLEGNYFTGTISDDISKLQRLGELFLTGNGLSGMIPISFGNLTSLSILKLDGNKLQGTIPSELGNCTRLLELNLSSNSLRGTIPKEVMSLSSLSSSLSMARNSLFGVVPFEVSKLINLKELDVSENKLSGEIPSSLSSCLSLENLRMGGNLFQGSIPGSLEALRGLEQINVSDNNLSGKIPDYLGKLPFLQKLDLSFNNFEGEVPNHGIFSNSSALSVAGNNKLCGGVPNLHLPPCSKPTKNSANKNHNGIVIVLATVPVIIFILLSSFFAIYYMVKKPTRQHVEASSLEDWQLGISFEEVYKSTDGFCEANLIGSGSFGSVYRGLSENGTTVAVKVLNLKQKGAVKSFMDECRTLQSMRHRNLLKIITACSSIDRQGNEFKCMVFQFMASGNLDEWLHPSNNARIRTKSLNIIQRLNIAIDVASAIDHLHNYCHATIVHCDLKPSNILLDEDLTAHVGDFGLAKFLLTESRNQAAVTIELKGSIGYIPPEYGASTQVSTLGDVYSYGILVLELFTGKRPTDDMFRDGLSIHKYVDMALPEHVMDVLDTSMTLVGKEKLRNGREVNETEEIAMVYSTDFQQNVSSRMEDTLVSLMNIGLSCSMPLPKERVPINIVVNRLHAIRDLLLQEK